MGSSQKSNNHQKSDKNKSNLYASLNTAYYVGAIVAGWIFAGPIADKFGRRVGMATGATLVVIATFMQCFGPRGNIGLFIGGRVLVGMGQGVACTAGPAYINEMAPTEVRGKIMSFWQMFYSVGSFIAYWVSLRSSLMLDVISDTRVGRVRLPEAQGKVG